MSFEFEGTTFEDAFRPDLIINKTGVDEVKAARALDQVFERQLLTCLKIMNLRLGLLMNFGMATMKAGIRRIAKLSGSRPVTSCSPCPRVRTMPNPCTGSPMIVTVFVNPTTILL